MLPVFVKAAKLEDKELFAKWTVETSGNCPDADILEYPTTRVRCAFNQNGPLIFMPTQVPLHLESLAINPKATAGETALAIRSLFQDAIRTTQENGSGEIYFVGSESTLPKFARHQLGGAMEKIEWPVYRIKISNL